MIRLIIEFSYIQNLSFLWLHPSLLLFAAWIIQLDVWGLKWGAQSILSCYFRDTGAKLDLCFFSWIAVTGLFRITQKRGYHHSPFLRPLKVHFSAPKRQILRDREGMLSLLQSCSRTCKNIPYVYAFFCLTLSFTSLSE